MTLSLGQQMARTAGIFQGITALPTMLIMGNCALEELFYPRVRVYYFITAACTGLMAAAILFVLFVQRHPKNTKTSTFYFETVKSALATALWLWLILDSIFGPRESQSWPPPEDRIRKVIEAGLCFFLLPILFYPTLIFAIVDRRSDTEEEADEEGGSPENEREPLLGAAPT